MRYLSAPLLLALSACASLSNGLNIGANSSPRRTPAYWVGRDINALIMKVGPYTSQQQLPNGTMAYSWYRAGAARAVTSHFGSVSITKAKMNQCETTYFVDPKTQTITDWTVSDDCR